MVDAQVAQEHARFFDRLVELIPAKHYLASSDDRVDLHSVKKAVRAALKQQFKAQAKANKRARLDPDAPGTTLEIQQQQAGKPLHAADGHAPLQPARATKIPAANLSGTSLSREELKKKLHAKLEALRAQNEKQSVARQAKEWRSKTLGKSALQATQEPGEKRKAEADGPHTAQQPSAIQKIGNGNQTAHQKQQTGQQEQEQRPNTEKPAAHAMRLDSVAVAGDLRFARVEFGDDRRSGPSKHTKKPSKEALLRAAEARQAEGAGGGLEQVEEGWRAALARASGEKVLDNPKLIKKSLKKEAKRREKSAKAWAERIRVQQEQQDKRQDRRTENLQARVDQKIEHKKERREQKLLRAGFEGRRTTFIGDPPSRN